VAATVSALPERLRALSKGRQRVDATLLELVQAVAEVTEDEREVVATVLDLLRSGRVRLTGNLRGQRL
jgi:hypothetical protein